MERYRFGDPFAKQAFPNALKREVRLEQSNCCLMCGNPAPKKKALEVHHKKPKSRGGSDNKENAAGLCPTDHLIANFMFIQYGITFDRLMDFLRPEKKR